MREVSGKVKKKMEHGQKELVCAKKDSEGNMITEKEEVKDSGINITSIGDKYMLIKWERFRK